MKLESIFLIEPLRRINWEKPNIFNSFEKSNFRLNLKTNQKTIMKIKLAATLFLFALVFTSCGEKTDVVESGTYVGTVDEVEAEKTEIYVKTEEDQTLELYFTEETTLTQNGEPVEFSALEKGQRVEVEVEKVGKRLDPISVTILE